MTVTSSNPRCDLDAESEIDITPEMIKVGAEVIEELRDILPATYLATRVYRSMAAVAARKAASSRPPPVPSNALKGD